MIKLCLFVPDETTFEIADEEGMLLWLEFPMWLPNATPRLRELALREYECILQRIHHHPSVTVVSLGCELNAGIDAEFLGQLYELVRRWMPNVLLCDNSGSAEAYGGVPTYLSDFYDFHFYAEPHYFPALIDHFTRASLPRKPWIYGEFCDADTMRDFSVLPANTWWLYDPVPLERDELNWMREYRRRLSDAGVTDNGAEFTHIARQQATSVRKHILEYVRSRNATGGYVVTGWMDTPIATSGVVDDHLNLKFNPVEWQRFNNNRVLLLGREHRRRWNGGDQPLRLDPYTFWDDSEAELHVRISNGGTDVTNAQLVWELRHEYKVISEDTLPVLLVKGGGTSEAASIAQHWLPNSSHWISQYELRASLISSSAEGKDEITNRWALWTVPLRQQCMQVIEQSRIDHALTAELLADVRRGETRVVWLRYPDAAPVRHAPFWRESIHVFPHHSYWDSMGNPPYADMRFYSVATEFALDPQLVVALAGSDATYIPIWRRFDARAMTWTDYIAEVHFGRGRLLITTLRHAGGAGYQPDTFATNPMGTWMLYALLQYARH